MASDKVDLYVEQNSDFYQTFVFEDINQLPVDITNYSFKAQIRVIPDDTVLAELDVVVDDAQDGYAHLFIPAATTLTIPVNDQVNPYRYDVIMYDTAGDQFIIFHGNLYVSDSITRL